MIASTQAAVTGPAGALGLLTEEPFATSFQQVCRFAPSIDTVHGHSMTLQMAMPIILGYFVYDLGYGCLVAEQSLGVLFIAHHALCVLIWPISYHHGIGCFYVLYMMSAELSTPLLWLVAYFLPKYNIMGSTRTVCGLIMVMSFFVVRVLPGPALLSSLLASQSYWTDVNVVVYGLAMVTLPLPSLLFSYWFFQIVQGMVAALSGPPEKAD